MPDMTNEMYAEDAAMIGATLAANPPPLEPPLEPAVQSQPYNIEALLNANEYMETEHSKRVVRQRHGPKEPVVSEARVGSDDRTIPRLRALTAKQYRAILAVPNEQRAMQGIGRTTRWTQHPPKAGNAQNAALSAEGRANLVCSRSLTQARRHSQIFHADDQETR